MGMIVHDGILQHGATGKVDLEENREEGLVIHSLSQTYLKWANSLLCERGVIVSDIGELEDGRIFVLLIDVLNGDEIRFTEADDERDADLHRIEAVLNYLQNHGIPLELSPHEVLHGDMKTILDLLWALILHFTIHSTNTPSSQRSLGRGRITIMEWCVDQLTDAKYRLHNSITENFKENNHLAELVEMSCSLSPPEDQKLESSVVRLTNALIAAEETLGIIKSILSPADVIQGTANEYSMLIFLALLKRKVAVLASSTTSTDPCEDDLSDPWYSLLHHTFSFKFIRADSLAGRLDLFKSSLAAIASSSHAPSQFLPLHQDMEGTTDRGIERRGLHGSHAGDGVDIHERSHVETGSLVPSIDSNREEDRERNALELSDDTGIDGDYIVGDELLELLETIGIKGKQMRQSLESTHHPLAPGTGGHHQRVIARLITELEMLRGENRKLFQALAESRSQTAQEGEGGLEEESLLKLCGLSAADRSGTARPVEAFVAMTLEENDLLRSQLSKMHSMTVRSTRDRDALERAEKENTELREKCAELEQVVARMTTDTEVKDKRLERLEHYMKIVQGQNAKLMRHMGAGQQGRSRSVSPAEVKPEDGSRAGSIEGGIEDDRVAQNRSSSRTGKFHSNGAVGDGVGEAGYSEEHSSRNMNGPHRCALLDGRGDARRLGGTTPGEHHPGHRNGPHINNSRGDATRSGNSHPRIVNESYNGCVVNGSSGGGGSQRNGPSHAMFVEDGLPDVKISSEIVQGHGNVRGLRNNYIGTTSGYHSHTMFDGGGDIASRSAGVSAGPHDAGLVPHRGEAEGSSNRATPGLPEVPRCDYGSLDLSEPETIQSDSDWAPEKTNNHHPTDLPSSLPVQRLQFNLQRGIRSPSLGSLIRACAAEGRSVNSSDHEEGPETVRRQRDQPHYGVDPFYTPQSKRTSRRDVTRSESRVPSSRRYNRFESIALESVHSGGNASHLGTRCCDTAGRAADQQPLTGLGSTPKWRQLRYSRAKTLPTDSNMRGKPRNPRGESSSIDKVLQDSSVRQSSTARTQQGFTSSLATGSSVSHRDNLHQLSQSIGSERSLSSDGYLPRAVSEQPHSRRSLPLSEGQASSPNERDLQRNIESDEFQPLPKRISDHRTLAELSPPRRQTQHPGASTSSARVSLSFDGMSSGILHQEEEYVPIHSFQSFRGERSTPHDSVSGRGTASKADSGISSCSSETPGYVHKMLSKADQSCANSIINRYLEAKK